MHSETDKAYLAGFIDGEGSIGIDNHGGVRTPSVRITITNTDINVLEEIKELWGGALSTRRIRVPGWKASSDLLIGAKTAVNLLKEIQPYLRIKKEQCEVAFKFQETVSSSQTRGVPLEIREYRQRLRTQMKLLNVRGTTS